MEKSVYTTESIGDIVQKMERDYISGSITRSKYVQTSFSDDVNKIYAYLDSKHTSGDQDSLGRDKPFFNISLTARNIWFRATDIDRKKIKLRATNSKHVLTSYVMSAKLQEWMRRENFGRFLNDWGINSAGFNESVVKFVEKDGRLIPSVVPWNKIICDPINFDNNPKIELLELNEAQLQTAGYEREVVEQLIQARQARETLDKRRKDNKSDYIKLYEVHGEFSQAQYKQAKEQEIDDNDHNIYFQQVHVISFVATEKKGEYDQYTVYCGKEDDPYMLTALLPEIDGSIALRGAVKVNFESQWMVNHTTKAIKDQLDLASKLFFQTADGSFVGQNALNAIETGDILIHEVNKPLVPVNNQSHDVASLQNYHSMWKTVGNELAGISESMLGQNPPSGTAWRQTEALLTESHSLFEIMTENKGLAIEDMLRRFILPFIKKGLDTKEEIVATLEDYGIDKIEEIYLKNKSIENVNNKKIDTLLNYKFDGTLNQQLEQIPTIEQEQQNLKEQLNVAGGTRFLKPSEVEEKTWKEIFKDAQWDPEVDVTNENLDTEAVTTLNTFITNVSRNPMMLQDPLLRKALDKILTYTGAMSPLEIGELPPPPTKPQAVT